MNAKSRYAVQTQVIEADGCGVRYFSTDVASSPVSRRVAKSQHNEYCSLWPDAERVTTTVYRRPDLAEVYSLRSYR